MSLTRLSLRLLLAAALSACAARPAATLTPSPAATAAPSSTPRPSPSPAPTLTPSATPTPAKPLRIGVMVDLSGGLQRFSTEMWNGLQIGLDYATGGARIAGRRPIELLLWDDYSSVDAGAEAARTLIETWGAELLVGNASSAVALQVQGLAREQGVLYFAAPAGSPDITGQNFNDHTFRICRNSAQDGPSLAAWALQNIGQRYIVLSDDANFDKAAAASFQAALRAQGARMLTGEPLIIPADRTDFSPYVAQVQGAAPDGLLVFWSGATPLFQQLTAAGAVMPRLTSFSSNAAVRELDPALAGMLGLSLYHWTLPHTPANDYLVREHQARFGSPPDLFSECGFATAQAIVAALNATGGDTAPEALIPALEGLTFEGPKGLYAIRAQDHQALAPLYIVRLTGPGEPAGRYFELVVEISAADSAPPCAAPGRCP